MMKRTRLLIFSAALWAALAGAAAAQYGAQPYGAQPYGAQPYGAQPYGQTVQPGGPMPSAVFAALVVAYEEHARWWKSQGVNLTPPEFTARHSAVHYAQEGPARLRVDFLPASPTIKGGGVGYIVDLNSLRVVNQFFER